MAIQPQSANMFKPELKHLIFIAFLVIASSERIVMKVCAHRVRSRPTVRKRDLLHMTSQISIA